MVDNLGREKEIKVVLLPEGLGMGWGVVTTMGPVAALAIVLGRDKIVVSTRGSLMMLIRV